MKSLADFAENAEQFFHEDLVSKRTDYAESNPRDPIALAIKFKCGRKIRKIKSASSARSAREKNKKYEKVL